MGMRISILSSKTQTTCPLWILSLVKQPNPWMLLGLMLALISNTRGLLYQCIYIALVHLQVDKYIVAEILIKLIA
jgi:hypothetical protein